VNEDDKLMAPPLPPPCQRLNPSNDPPAPQPHLPPFGRALEYKIKTQFASTVVWDFLASKTTTTRCGLLRMCALRIQSS